MPYGFLNKEQPIRPSPMSLVLCEEKEAAGWLGDTTRWREGVQHPAVPSDQLSGRIFCNDRRGY